MCGNSLGHSTFQSILRLKKKRVAAEDAEAAVEEPAVEAAAAEAAAAEAAKAATAAAAAAAAAEEDKEKTRTEDDTAAAEATAPERDEEEDGKDSKEEKEDGGEEAAAKAEEVKKEGDAAADKKDSDEPLVSAKKCPSTVARFKANSGGSVKALRRFLASFSEGDSTGSLGAFSGKLGQQAPCRSYQFLKTIDEIAEVSQEFEKAQTKQGLSNIINGCKPHKSAVCELISMSQSAGKRLVAALETVKSARKRAANAAVAPKASLKRQRKDPKVVDTTTMLQGAGAEPKRGTCVLEDGKAVLSESCKSLDPLQPFLVYVAKKNADEEFPHERACSVFREAFLASDKHSDPGRARKPAGSSWLSYDMHTFRTSSGLGASCCKQCKVPSLSLYK